MDELDWAEQFPPRMPVLHAYLHYAEQLQQFARHFAAGVEEKKWNNPDSVAAVAKTYLYIRFGIETDVTSVDVIAAARDSGTLHADGHRIKGGLISVWQDSMRADKKRRRIEARDKARAEKRSIKQFIKALKHF